MGVVGRDKSRPTLNGAVVVKARFNWPNAACAASKKPNAISMAQDEAALDEVKCGRRRLA